jgi:hypothetical protein
LLEAKCPRRPAATITTLTAATCGVLTDSWAFALRTWGTPQGTLCPRRTSSGCIVGFPISYAGPSCEVRDAPFAQSNAGFLRTGRAGSLRELTELGRRTPCEPGNPGRRGGEHGRPRRAAKANRAGYTGIQVATQCGQHDPGTSAFGNPRPLGLPRTRTSPNLLVSSDTGPGRLHQLSILTRRRDRIGGSPTLPEGEMGRCAGEPEK